MKPNILFIVIDSLRADRIFGRQKIANSPNIDYLIKKGVYFSNAITTCQYTTQVMQSIFTSRFPVAVKTTKKLHTEMHSKTSPLLLLKNHGYKTNAIVQEDQFIQGFTERFDNDDTSFKSEENLYNGLAERINFKDFSGELLFSFKRSFHCCFQPRKLSSLYILSS